MIQPLAWRYAAFAALLIVIVTAARAEPNTPHVNYMLHCQGCHLPGGVGHPGIVPPLNDQVGQFLGSDAGRAYLVQVPGVAQSALNDADLAQVLNWMLLEFDPVHVQPDFRRYTEAEVTRYRAKPIIDVSAVRRELLATH